MMPASIETKLDFFATVSGILEGCSFSEPRPQFVLRSDVIHLSNLKIDRRNSK